MENQKTDDAATMARVPPPPTGSAIVLVKVENTGLRLTGKWIRPDGVNYVKETEPCPEAKACVWSRDMDELESAERYAKANGFKVMVLPDANDVLSVARSSFLQNAKDSRED